MTSLASLPSALPAPPSLTFRTSPAIALAAQTTAIIGTVSAIPVFWQLPGRFLAGAAAAGGAALNNSIANLAGFGAPALLGYIKTQTGGLAPGLLIAAALLDLRRQAALPRAAAPHAVELLDLARLVTARRPTPSAVLRR